MANVCVISPLLQMSCVLLPQLLGYGWGKSRAISTITYSVCRGLSPMDCPGSSLFTLSNLPNEIPVRLMWLHSDTAKHFSCDPDFHQMLLVGLL